MTQDTKRLLYSVQDECKAIRRTMDTYMYGSNVPDEDMAYLRKVYGAVCKVMDLL